MNITFSKTDLENAPARAALVALVDTAQHGGFIRIHGFKAKYGHGEVQDTTYCKGISYPNAVEKSLAILDGIRKNGNYSITVTRGVWNDAEGNANPTNRKSKAYCNAATKTETYEAGHPVLNDAIAKLYKSLVAPEKPTKEYVSLGNGIYEDEGKTLYIRDLRLVKKTIVVHGDYPHKAQGEVNAVADAIKRDMPVGMYRMFRLDSDFDALSIGGTEIKPDSETMDKIQQAKVKVEVEETEKV
jgi:hypothetical protein